MRILFAGTPEIGVPSLGALADSFEVCGVLTNPDRVQGRKKKLLFSPIKEKALELNIPVFQPEKLDLEFINTVKELKPDLLVCIAFGKIFRDNFLSIFPEGGINLHPSLLPIYRGASPLNAVILNGEKTTGISIQRLAKKMDSGNILFQNSFNLEGTETTGSLIGKVAKMGAPLIVEVVKGIEKGDINEYSQDHTKATFCSLIKKEDGIINWNKPSLDILNAVRGYNPWPLAQTKFGDKSLNILEANGSYNDELEANYITNGVKAGTVISYSKQRGYVVKTQDGIIYVTKLQLQSKKILDYKSFNNGVQDFVGTQLG
ncbi:MAG: methionyl-tRNA formyltransferase [Spirochaetaceae bacterium 4572_7]|nr:MAG: methionyl-tRNA formyltransferase [Spirochaetaceae bacterium 4572_7]